MDVILITGATGLIGSALTQHLLERGIAVRHLGRSRPKRTVVPHFQWDPTRGTLDSDALMGVSHIVHLAGAGIADQRWSRSRVDELINSRTATSRLLQQAVRTQGLPVRAFVSAAGIGYYGAKTRQHILTERDPAGTDTIATISSEWERAVDEWSPVARVVKLRTPLVLARHGGALPKLATPVRLGIGAALGTGKQWVPWVHIDDLVRCYTAALFDDRYSGAYNVSTGSDATNDELMRTLCGVLGRPYFMPHVPGPVLHLMVGGISSVLLEGSRVSNARLLSTGFSFGHSTLEMALRDLLH